MTSADCFNRKILYKRMKTLLFVYCMVMGMVQVYSRSSGSGNSSRSKQKVSYTFSSWKGENSIENMGHPRELHAQRPSPMTRRRRLQHHDNEEEDRILVHDERFVQYENHPHDDDSGTRSRLRNLVEVNNESLFKPIRMHFDTTELELWTMTSKEYMRKVQYLKTMVLPGMAQVWSEALAVVPVSQRLKMDFAWCPFGNPTKSTAFINGGVQHTDLVIFVTANSDVCASGATLASAYSCFWDQYERPTGGNIDFCLDTITVPSSFQTTTDNMDVLKGVTNTNSKASLQQTNSSTTSTNTNTTTTTPVKEESLEDTKLLKQAVGTAIHEFAHVLGITSSDLLFFYDWKTGRPRTGHPQKEHVTCVNGQTEYHRMPSKDVLQFTKSDQDVISYFVVTPTVQQVVQNQFNCPTALGARLENQPTNGDCFGSHFDERHYFTENMSPVIGAVPEVFSSLTLALLEDSGWYIPNYKQAQVSPFGHLAGCDFLDKPCINQGTIPTYSKGFFCNKEYSFNMKGQFIGSFGCDPTHTHIASCDLVDYSKTNRGIIPPPKPYRYFPQNPNLGSVTRTADYCPTYSLDAVPCVGIGEYVSKVPKLSGNLHSIEHSGKQSKCFESNNKRPLCLQTKCDKKSNTVKFYVDNKEYTCLQDDQAIEIASNVVIRCPRLASICPNLICPSNCSGAGICKNLSSEKTAIPKCECFDKSDTTSGCYGNSLHVVNRQSWQQAISSSHPILPSWMIMMTTLSIGVFFFK